MRAALDVMYARWLAVGENEHLVLTWPVQSLPQGRTPRTPHATRRARTLRK